MSTAALRFALGLLGIGWASNGWADAPAEAAASSTAAATSVTYHVISLEKFSRKPLSHYKSTDSWAIPPRGRQIVGGVPFLIEGKVEVTGLGAARDGTFFPTRITDIPARVQGQTIHLLHGAGYAAKDGTPMAEMVVHYHNGAKRSLIISYGVHSRNWYEEVTESSREVSDPHSAVGWYGAREDTGFSPALRLYTTAWPNPLPEELIDHIDFYSLFSRATPAILGLTVAEETKSSSSDLLDPPVTVAADEGVASSQWRAQLKVRVLDKANGLLLTNATVDVRCTDGTKWIGFGQLRETGPARWDYPPSTFQLVRLTAVALGYTPASEVFAPREDGLFQPELEIKLNRGQTIAGVVHDPEDKGIPGAQVTVRTSLRDENDRLIPVDYPSLTTDQNGRWSLSGLPVTSVLQILLEHPRYESRIVRNDPGNPETRTLEAELGAGKARLLMIPGWLVRGTITDALGHPVAGAELIWGDATLPWTNQTRTRPEANGAFEFSVVERGPPTVVVLAPGYRPKLFKVAPGPNSRAITLVLDQAKPLHGRVVDAAGAGLAGVMVTVDGWQQTRCLNWTTQTDKAGRFVWETPPAGAVELGFNKVGYRPLRRLSVLAAGEELKVQLEPTAKPGPQRARPDKILF